MRDLDTWTHYIVEETSFLSTQAFLSPSFHSTMSCWGPQPLDLLYGLALCAGDEEVRKQMGLTLPVLGKQLAARRGFALSPKDVHSIPYSALDTPGCQGTAEERGCMVASLTGQIFRTGFIRSFVFTWISSDFSP